MARSFVDVKERLVFLTALILFLWFIEFVNFFFFRGYLNLLGIQPRHISSLWHIPFVPFLHGSFAHLASNTIPLFVLGWLVLMRGWENFWVVTAFCVLVSGLGIWIFAPYNTIHIGASGLIFGYLGYLLMRGYVERSPSAVLVAILVGIFYGGAIVGVLPGQPSVSWQGHLFGFAGGVGCARLIAAARLH